MPKLQWFRLYSEARMDAKLAILTDTEFRVWFRLLCLASENEPRGSIPVGTALEVQAAGGDKMLLNQVIQKLLDLDILDSELRFIHWDARQYDYPSSSPAAVGERVRKYRELKRGVTRSNELVTRCNVESRGEENREDKSRGEEITPAIARRTTLTEEEKALLYEAFAPWWTQEQIDQRVEEALNHTASKKAKSAYLYCRTWLRRDAERQPHRLAEPGDRDVAKYYAWPNRDRRTK